MMHMDGTTIQYCVPNAYISAGIDIIDIPDN